VNPKTGAFIAGLGVFLLLLLNVGWGDIPVLVRAYAVLGMGMVCIAAFFTSRGSSSLEVEVGAEVAHQVASGVGAAIILGSFFASLGGPFWGLLDEEGFGPSASRDIELETQVLTDRTASLTVDASMLDLTVVGWGNAELAVNGSVKVFAENAERAKELLGQTDVSMTRDTESGRPAFRISVSAPKPKSLFGRRGCKLSLTVRVPQEAIIDLECKSVSGRYSVRNLRLGKADLETVNGDFELSNVEGDHLSISTVDGAISGTLAFGSANVSTLNGRMDLELGARTGAYRFKATNGNLVVVLPQAEEIGYSLKASTVNGAVRLEAPALDYMVDRSNKKEARSTGFEQKLVKITVEATTINGDVRAGMEGS